MDDSPESRPAERPLTPLFAALWTLALALLSSLCAAVTQGARPGAQNDIVNLAACEVLATSFIVFLVVRVHARDVSLRALLAFRPIAPLHAVLSMAAGAGLYPLLTTIDDLVQKRWPVDDPEMTQSLQKIVASSSPVALVVAALVVMPVARELFFRGLLYGGVKRRAGVQSALLVTAACYACASLQWQQIPTLFVLGMAAAWLCERTGTVVAAILAQLAYGAVEGIPILRGADPMADVTYPTKWIVGGAIIALLALVAVGAGRREE